MAAAHRRIRRNRRYRQGLPIQRVFRDRFDPLSYSDEELFERYRFRRPTIIFIHDEIQANLKRPTGRNMALTPILSLLLCLRFLATGATQLLIGDSLHISRNAAGREIRAVASLLVDAFRRFIRFPVGEVAHRVMEGFRRIAGFPQVLGCVDGTFIRIQTPTENEADYVNRKGFHSLNVQMVCDPNFRVTSLCARWPGSTHDSRVWRSSSLCHQFETGVHKGLLLGDSGYPCTRYLMTPYNVPTGAAQESYNKALCRTRVLIEQTYGILKKRFQCLHYGLRCTPERAITYITACVVLHNIGIDKFDIFLADNCLNYDVTQCISNHANVPNNNDGCRKRNEITRVFFS